MEQRYPRYQGYAEGSEEQVSPMSFFISNLYAIGESNTPPGIPSVMYNNEPTPVESGNGRVSSSHSSSSALTALPRWPSSRVSEPVQIAMPKPAVPSRGSRRKGGSLPFFEVSSPVNTIRPHPAPATQRSMFADVSREQKVAKDSKGSKGSKSSTPRTLEEQGRRRRMIIGCIITIFGVLSAIGIVLGLVLGLKAGPSVAEQSGPQPSTAIIPTGTTEPTPPTSTTRNSDLPTATAPAGSESISTTSQSGQPWLFFQNAQGFISRVVLNPSATSWTGVSNFVKARKNTPIASTFFESRWYAGQENYRFQGFENRTSVIYLDDGNYLNEWIFSGSSSDTGQPGPLTRQKYLAHPSSKLAAYWPRIVYQGNSGEIREITYNCSSKTQCYYDKALSTTQARNGTQLLALPVKSDLTSTAVFYQEQDGQFLEYCEDSSGVTTVLQNPAFSDLVPLDAPVAGFSALRPTGAQNPNLSLYLLWQDSNGIIQLSYTDDTNVWKGPHTDPAFAGANNNTALSCVSGSTFPGFPLQPTTVLARCYFQTGTALREVSFNGDVWNMTGVVPLDF